MYGLNINNTRYLEIIGNIFDTNTSGGVNCATSNFDINIIGNIIQSLNNTSGLDRRCYAMANAPITVNNSAGYTAP